MLPVFSKVEIHSMPRLGMHCDITRVLAHKRSSTASAITPRPIRTNHAATSRVGVAFNPVEPWWCQLSVRTTECSCSKPWLHKAHSQRVMPQQSARHRQSDLLSIFLVQIVSILAGCVQHKKQQAVPPLVRLQLHGVLHPLLIQHINTAHVAMIFQQNGGSRELVPLGVVTSQPSRNACTIVHWLCCSGQQPHRFVVHPTHGCNLTRSVHSHIEMPTR